MNARSVTNEASRNEAPTTPPPVAKNSQSGTESDRAGAERRLPPCASAGPTRSTPPSTSENSPARPDRRARSDHERGDDRCRFRDRGRVRDVIDGDREPGEVYLSERRQGERTVRDPGRGRWKRRETEEKGGEMEGKTGEEKGGEMEGKTGEEKWRGEEGWWGPVRSQPRMAPT
jgi:hypothetical protein